MTTTLVRRQLCLFAALTPVVGRATAKTDDRIIDVWKSPTCGCCADWVRHLEDNGFTARLHDTGNSLVRKQLGLPVKFGACHTARISGYAIEGHVPAADIVKLLAEKPTAIGLAVPGMPVGSPGMDGPAYRGRQDPYDVLIVRKDGSAQVFQAYR